MGDSISRYITLGVIIIITLLGIGSAMIFFNNGQDVVNEGLKNQSKTTQDIINTKITKYTDKVITGATVVSCIKEFEDEAGSFIIVVDNGSGGVQQYISTGNYTDGSVDLTPTAKSRTDMSNDLKDIQDPTVSASFVNTAQEYYGYRRFRADGSIGAIYFEIQP